MGLSKIGKYFSIFLVFSLLHHGSHCKHEIPSNFYGSSEVFSGYLSEQQQYVDAFSLHPDHVLISGSIQEVEHGLATSQDTGKSCYAWPLFVGQREFVS